MPATPEEQHNWLHSVTADHPVACSRVNGVRVVRDVKSTQSTCYFLRAPGETIGFVVKCFSKLYCSNVEDAASKEYEGLQALARAVTPLEDVVAPEPVHLIQGRGCYVMGEVEGSVLPSMLMRVPSAITVETACAILRGLAAYHNETGEPFVDCQPKNVLVTSQHQVCLLDPTATNPILYELANRAATLMAADLGYWAFSVSADVAKLRRGAKQLRRFTETMLVQACGMEDLMTDSSAIFGAAEAHRLRLAAEGRIRPRVLAVLMLAVLKSMRQSVEHGVSEGAVSA